MADQVCAQQGTMRAAVEVYAQGMDVVPQLDHG
ncbi:hypothetical protein ABIA33_006436 [Streptacidiphilus sp. MAP12-16]